MKDAAGDVKEKVQAAAGKEPKDESKEPFGEKIKAAAEDLKEKVEDAAEAVEDKVEEVAEKVEDKID